MEAGEEPQRFRPPQTPFELEVLLEQIFCNLGLVDLENCCLVSESWNVTASKALQELRDAFHRVQCRLVPSKETLEMALRNKEQLFIMENKLPLWDLLRTRCSASNHDSSHRFLFDYETPDCLTNPASPLYRFGFNPEFSTFISASYDRTIAAFLTNPLLSDFVGSVTLNRRFADLEAVLEILTKLPNLKKLKLQLEVQICRAILGPEWVSNLSEAATSSVKKLELDLVHSAGTLPEFELGADLLLESEIQKYISAIFKVCCNLKIFKLIDSYTDHYQPIPFNLELFRSLKRPARLRTLKICTAHHEKLPYIYGKVLIFNVLSNLKSLDLRTWGRLPLADWNLIATNNTFLPNVESLHMCLHHSERTKQLLGNKFVQLNQRTTLKCLTLDLIWGESRPFEHFQEEWNVVQEGGPLTLTKAIHFADETGSFVDLNLFEHLTDLSLVSSAAAKLLKERRCTSNTEKHVVTLIWRKDEQKQGHNEGQKPTQDETLKLTDASVYSTMARWPIDLKTAYWHQHVTLRIHKRALAAALAAAPSCVNRLEITLPKDDFIYTRSEDEEKSKAGEFLQVSGAVDAAQFGQFCSRCRLDESVVKCVYSKEQKKLNRLVKTLDPQTPNDGSPFWRAMESTSEDNCQPCCEFVLVLA